MIYCYLGVSFIMFSFNYSELLDSLLCLEFILLGILLLVLCSNFIGSGWLIYLLILGVCDGVVGLLIFVIMAYKVGMDDYYFMEFEW